MKLKGLLVIIGLVQLILGIAYLFFPQAMLHWMGHSATAADINYPLGMLAARFLAYGVGMFVIACDPHKHVFWINNMILIQAIDLGVGTAYTLSGIVALSFSGFPMFNAALIAILLWVWRPQSIAAIQART
jgi:hypothetical protein